MAPGRADGLRLGRRRRWRAGAVSCPSGLLSYEYFTGRGGRDCGSGRYDGARGGLPGGRDPAGRCRRRPRLRGPGRSTRTYKLTSPRAVSGSTDRPPARPPDRPPPRFGRRKASGARKDIYYRDDLYTQHSLHTYKYVLYIYIYLYRYRNNGK